MPLLIPETSDVKFAICVVVEMIGFRVFLLQGYGEDEKEESINQSVISQYLYDLETHSRTRINALVLHLGGLSETEVIELGIEPKACAMMLDSYTYHLIKHLLEGRCGIPMEV